MVKCILSVLLLLSLFITPALADPFEFLEDYAADISELYNPDDPSAGTFVFSCRYPHVDEHAEGGAVINAFYEYQLNDAVDYLVPMLQDGYWGEDFSTVITYTVTCNSEDYFSVLLRTEKNRSETSVVQWKGQVFSREYAYGATCSLPVLLGILDQNEKDEEIQSYQTEKVSKTIRKMVWNLIEEDDSQTLANCLSEEDLAYLFFPAEDFYLDENGDPVFYLQPYYVLETVPDNAELITFTIPFEDILDEL